MLLSLSHWLMQAYPEQLGFLRVIQYITFRAVLAAMTSLLIGLAFGPWVIRRLTEMKIGQPIREYGVQAHLGKRGTTGALRLMWHSEWKRCSRRGARTAGLCFVSLPLRVCGMNTAKAHAAATWTSRA